MELRRFLNSIVQKWWLIVLLVVLGGGISFLSIFLSKPMYKANTTLCIINQDITDEALNSSQFFRQYYEVIYSRSLISMVLRNLNNVYLTENEFIKMISIDSKTNSNIITISAKYHDPTVAAAIANATGKEFITQIRLLTKSDNIVILDEAQVPAFPISNLLSRILLGQLTGLMVALCIIYLIEYFDTTVRFAEDIENGIKVRVIGIIPEYDIE
jgi:capsular polysaccharide biosynthesis protein